MVGYVGRFRALAGVLVASAFNLPVRINNRIEGDNLILGGVLGWFRKGLYLPLQ